MTDPPSPNRSIGILTSGGDAPGMNAAVRAVARTALDRGVDAYAVYEGYQGLVDGGDRIRRLRWNDVGGVLHRGGTVIGTARCQSFRERDGRRVAALHMIERRMEGLVVIGGDGSLTGADLFRQEWPELVGELRAEGRIDDDQAARHPLLRIVGLAGSIDNDMFGTDMTIGADTALHRITEAVDAIGSTAASHQRTFVVEVMGRHCGYLALMSALATGADWLLIPENPPKAEVWEDALCARIRAGREAGRRKSVIVVAEGARDTEGKAIRAADVERLLEERLGEDVRVTVLGHVQRGGAPTAFDRYLGTVLGHAAVGRLLDAEPDEEPQLIGVREGRVTHSPLMQCVAKTRGVAELISRGDYEGAMAERGHSFGEAWRTYRTLVGSLPDPPSERRPLRIAVLHAGGPAPGMNTAVRAAVRLAIDRGCEVVGVHRGFKGLAAEEFVELGWMSVHGWASRGGAELGTGRDVPKGKQLYAVARSLEENRIGALLVVGGSAGYEGAHRLFTERETFPAFGIPIACVPASINNNLPGCDLSVGSDTALNAIVHAVDRIKQSATAARRCFVVEVMGRNCGFLALMSGLATGAERTYLNEEGVRLDDLRENLDLLVDGFRAGKQLGLIIRSENAHNLYTTGFMCALFEEEGGDLFDVRPAILGHLQQGGDPTPFDRIRATRLAARAVEFLTDEAGKPDPGGVFVGFDKGRLRLTPLEDFPRQWDAETRRPRQQWWLSLRPIAKLLARTRPSAEAAASGGGDPAAHHSKNGT